MPVRLLADCGNTAVKLARAADGRVLEPVRIEPRAEALAAWLAGQADAAELVVAAGSRRHAGILRAAWDACAGGRPWRQAGGDLALPDLGQYAGCGVDRVLAGLGLDTCGEDGVVAIDAGTATTLTAWRPGPRFAGGLILPGPEACLAGLHLRAPALPLVAPAAPGGRADQHGTAGALAAAIAIGHPAMVAACLERLCADSGCRAAVLTGGGAEALIDALPGASLRPHLVLAGLARLAG